MPSKESSESILSGPSSRSEGRTLPPHVRPLVWPPSDPQISQSLLQVWSDGNWGRYEGPYTERLCQLLSDFHGVPHVYLCASGTCAVELALRGLAIEPGQEVVLAGYDFPGNFRAIEAIGARPVLVDVAPERWTIDTSALERAMDSDRVRAVIVSHLHGDLAPVADQVLSLARAQGVAVVEDACQVPGAWVDGQRAGTWGTVGVLSFGGSKLLTAGRGGAILTRSPEVLQRIKIFAERGNVAYPLSQLQAAVLLPQLMRLDEQNQFRLERARLWSQVLHEALGWRPVQWSEPNRPAFYKLAFHVPEDSRLSLEVALQRAQRLGFPWGPGFRGFARRSPRRCRAVGSLENSQRAAEQTLLIDHTHLVADPQAVLDYLLQETSP